MRHDPPLAPHRRLAPPERRGVAETQAAVWLRHAQMALVQPCSGTTTSRLVIRAAPSPAPGAPGVVETQRRLRVGDGAGARRKASALYGAALRYAPIPPAMRCAGTKMYGMMPRAAAERYLAGKGQPPPSGDPSLKPHRCCHSRRAWSTPASGAAAAGAEVRRRSLGAGCPSRRFGCLCRSYGNACPGLMAGA